MGGTCGKRGRDEMLDGVKVKWFLFLTKHHATNTYWGSGGIGPLSLNLGAWWR
jgi:hypothetical protein